MINDLDNLTIDTVNPEGASQLTPPSDPPVMEEPINNHVHGLHISPTGSSAATTAEFRVGITPLLPKVNF